MESVKKKKVGRGPEKTFFKKREIDGQLTHGKTLNITNYRNQTHVPRSGTLKS